MLAEPARYADEDTMRDARRHYFETNRFGDDGGYADAWVDFKLGPVPFPFPNSPSRVRALRYHDLHHVLTGYATTTTGEFEISAWEIGAGCKDFAAAWVLNLGGIGAGLFVAPVRLWQAFVRGRRSRSLYGESLDEVLDATVGATRRRYVAPPGGNEASVADALLFSVSAVCGLVVGSVFIALLVPLVPVGLLMNWRRRRHVATVG